VEKTLKYIDFVALLSAFRMPNKHAMRRIMKKEQGPRIEDRKPRTFCPWHMRADKAQDYAG